MKILTLCFLSLLTLNAIAEEDWQLAKDEDGIVVYTRMNNKTELKDFKATVTINAPIKKVLSSMHNAEEHTQWFYNRVVTKTLANKNNQDYIVYSETSAPWPVSNRDVVITYNFTNNADNTVTRIDVNHLDDYLPTKDGLVRVPYIKGYWEISKIDSNNTKVFFMNSASPGGSLPNWLADSGVIDMPFNSLGGLRALLENPESVE